MCLFSKITLNKKFTPNKKNGGVIPAVNDIRTLYTPVECGKCIECMRGKARDWKVRLQEDIKTYKNGKFIMLSFSNESIRELRNYVYEVKEKPFILGYELDNEIAIAGVALFRERYRRKYGYSPRHWLITELGHKGTENIHLHGIIWTDKTMNEIEERWQYGFIGRGRKQPDGSYKNWVDNQSVNYIVKYVTKTDKDHQYYRPIILASKGIGARYLYQEQYYSHCEEWTKRRKNGTWTVERINKMIKVSNNWGDWNRNTYKEDGKTKDTYKTANGTEIALPKYYRRKIYTDEEREKLWIEKLNKNVRYVCGEKVEADSKAYWKLLKYHQDRNARLGYGDAKQDWERYEYEQSRRILMQNKRMKNSK